MWCHANSYDIMPCRVFFMSCDVKLSHPMLWHLMSYNIPWCVVRGYGSCDMMSNDCLLLDVIFCDMVWLMCCYTMCYHVILHNVTLCHLMSVMFSYAILCYVVQFYNIIVYVALWCHITSHPVMWWNIMECDEKLWFMHFLFKIKEPYDPCCVVSFPLLDTWHLILEAWSLKLDAWYFILQTGWLIIDIWYLILNTWCLILYTLYFKLANWCLIFDYWYLILEPWYMIFDISYSCVMVGQWHPCTKLSAAMLAW